jgi:hypothetical protein
MRRLILAAMVAGTASQAPAAELDLMVGFRSVMAAAIRDEGYNCPDVKRVVHTGPDRFGTVLKVTCGPLGQDEAWEDKPLRSPPISKVISPQSPGGAARRERLRTEPSRAPGVHGRPGGCDG